MIFRHGVLPAVTGVESHVCILLVLYLNKFNFACRSYLLPSLCQPASSFSSIWLPFLVRNMIGPRMGLISGYTGCCSLYHGVCFSTLAKHPPGCISNPLLSLSVQLLMAVHFSSTQPSSGTSAVRIPSV